VTLTKLKIKSFIFYKEKNKNPKLNMSSKFLLITISISVIFGFVAWWYFFDNNRNPSTIISTTENAESKRQVYAKIFHPRTKSSSGQNKNHPTVAIDAGICYPQAGSPIWQPVNCPDDSHWILWLKERAKIRNDPLQGLNEAYLEDNPHHRELERWFMVDVGANKGFTLAKWMESLKGASREKGRYNMFKLIQEALEQTAGNMSDRIGASCGACCDCADDEIDFESEAEFEYLSPFSKRYYDGASTSPLPVRMLALEPVKANFDFVSKFFHKDEAGKKMFDIRWAAGSSTNSIARFRTGPFGVETFSFTTGRRSSKKGLFAPANVAVVNLDDLILNASYAQSEENFIEFQNNLMNVSNKADIVKAFSSYNNTVPYIDVLTTDTEGFDLNVAIGADTLLKSGRVKMYIFELHQKKMGSRAVNYRDVFGKLESYGYECYYPAMPGKRGETVDLPHLVKITGDKCFHGRFGGFIGWMNAVCAHRQSAPELVNIFGKLTKEIKKSRVTCGTKPEVEAAHARVEKWFADGFRS
jgi:hypothetical protein